jgi:4a-hydroxytetrahydrobiopterin dehydratase
VAGLAWIDALAGPEVLPFWRAVLGYRDRGDSPEDLIDPYGRGPLLYFQQMDVPRPQRNRITRQCPRMPR